MIIRKLIGNRPGLYIHSCIPEIWQKFKYGAFGGSEGGIKMAHSGRKIISGLRSFDFWIIFAA
jgi:hypothetical protein